jgi:hypothetical protein
MEALVHEGLGKERGGALDGVEREPVFPGIERFGRGQLGQARDGFGVPDEEDGCVI